MESILIGRSLGGRYLLEELLGRGGMSVVYRATDQTLGRPVAVKVIRFEAGSDEMRDHLRRRFRREAGSSARIPPHPNVVRVYDYGTDSELDLDFLVMELLKGMDLKRALAAADIPRDEALLILLQAARGVAAGHRAGIVHRDIKPANIFLVDGDTHQVRVLDFGIAKAMDTAAEDDLTQVGSAPYSPAYASPEQRAPGEAVTPASDVYQLGLVGYELLAGVRPFAQQERAAAPGGTPLPLPSRGRWDQVPAPLQRVIARALDPVAARRFQDASAFADALEGKAPQGDETLLVQAPGGDPAADATLLAERTETRAETALLAGAGGRAPGARALPDWIGQPRVRRAGAAAAILLLLTLVGIGMLRGRSSPDAAPPTEVMESFHNLESRASGQMERAGMWER